MHFIILWKRKIYICVGSTFFCDLKKSRSFDVSPEQNLTSSNISCNKEYFVVRICGVTMKHEYKLISTEGLL